MTHTLMKVSLIGAVAPMLALAQIPPVPPTPPTPPVAPLPPVPPTPPKVWIEPKFDYHFDLKHDYDYDLKISQKEIERARQEALREMQRAQTEMQREQAQAQRELQREMQRQQTEQQRAIQQAQVEAQREMQRAQVEMQRAQAEAQKVQREFEKDFKYNYNYSYKPGFSSGERLLNATPRAAWAQGDPADSLYRLARESLNRGEYRRAATVFSELTTKFPRSQYALDATYWEAFARYRTGTTDDLRAALRILDTNKERFLYLRQNESSMDVPALTTRVLGALASRGDSDAKRRLESEAAQTQGACDREDISVRAEALRALGQMDPASALPVVKRVLSRRDECTVELRRQALYVLGRQPNAETTQILLDVAKNEPDQGVRGEAMSWLSRVGGDAAVPLLEDILRNSTDERTQRSAISALGSMDTERSRRAVRAIIERTDANERVRIEAVSSLARDRDGRSMTPDEAAYLRGLYAKLETQRLKEAVLSAVSRIEAPDNEQFLLSIARNQNEIPSLRSSAIQRLGRMSTVDLNDIAKLYEVADSRSMREQILQALAQRKEPEAVDKIVEAAKKDTDYNIRRYAIQLLMRSNHPKALQGIKELAGQ